MNCAEVADLLGAYALDALPADEKAAVEGHLATCNLHGEVLGLLSAAGAVAFTSATEMPRPELRSRILAAIARDDPEATHSDPPLIVLPITPLRSRRLTWAPYALAAVFAVISLGLLAWNLVLVSGGDSAEPRVVLLTGSTGFGAVVVEDDATLVQVSGLPALDSSRAYQVWVIEDGAPEPAGLLAPDAGGNATHNLGRAVPDSAVIAITVEPAGGSPRPTTDPILVAEL
jgi:anti-sigma-K factor RskA